MPTMDEPDESASLGKLLLVADGKVGKTHYAGMAAAAGFNVLYFDGDVGGPTLRRLPIEARRRIYRLDVADSLGGGIKDSKFLNTMQEFSSNIVFRWNDTKQRIATRADDGVDTVWEIRPAQLDHTCVFVLDSWTGLSESMMTAAGIANNVDVANASTSEMRPVYQSAGLKSMQMLQIIRSLRCHVIVLSHPDEFTHTTRREGAILGKVKEADQTIDWTKMIPKSTSKPNSMQMGKYFTDIAWMQTNATGSERQLNFRLDNGRVSGGHFSDIKSVDEYSFANLVRQIGGSVPGDAGAPADSWLKILPAGVKALMPLQQVEQQVLDGRESQVVVSSDPAKPKTLSDMFKKPTA